MARIVVPLVTMILNTDFSKWLKLKIFSRNVLVFFLIFALNMECKYTLEPLRRHSMLSIKNKKNRIKNKKNRHTPAKTNFSI